MTGSTKPTSSSLDMPALRVDPGSSINDYAEKDSTRLWLKGILYLSTVVIIILGTLVIFTFEPCMVDTSGNLLDEAPAFCQNL